MGREPGNRRMLTTRALARRNRIAGDASCMFIRRAVHGHASLSSVILEELHLYASADRPTGRALSQCPYDANPARPFGRRPSPPTRGLPEPAEVGQVDPRIVAVDVETVAAEEADERDTEPIRGLDREV